ncbi:substrate-binding domain-containing protein [Mesoterricola sediminis]|uniref:Sugar ABC transporter substrate-binding protein n=1 Tax=Mesoterricola sediminis TaxID=2927980 RepID=A0AA48KDB6_9BACT|nr:substrate-binding domain-containing protein [Mesoterricola sediminis]BDU78109.1 sugar ABC transporter substrate-binding protein [Mesoterricola sediminis]
MFPGTRSLLRRALLAGAAVALLGAAPGWDGPTRGPAAKPGRTIVYLASDSRNGGVTGVFRGLQAATGQLGWRIHFLDGAGSPGTLDVQWEKAMALRPDAIVLGGFDASAWRDRLAGARKAGIRVAGWHAAPEPGPTPDLVVNVATQARAVAELAVAAVARDAEARGRDAGIVVFTDSRFAVARAKTTAMVQAAAAHRGPHRLRILAVEDVPLPEVHRAMPALVPALAKRHGAAWTHCLAINDLYFDNIHYPLAQAGRADVVQVSAGDGSSLALSRIRSGLSRQVATVAEPLRLQGFQLADELNRAFAGEAPSGYVSRPLLVDAAALKAAPGGDIERGLGFEAAYARIWRVRTGP